MKRALVPIIALITLFASIQLAAQETEVDRKPLIEVFTSSSCPPCVLGNLVVDGVLDQYPDQYTLIKYQMNWPGNGDPYYLDDSYARRAYYEVTGVPSLRTNGLDAGYPGYWTTNMFDQLAGKTHMTISGEAALTAASGGFGKSGGMVVNCQIDITALEAYGAGLRAYAAVVEEKTFGNATTNGETVFYNVVQGFLLSSDGEQLGTLDADEVKAFDLTLDLSDTNVETGNDLSIVVFVQNNSTKEIIQSEMFEVAHPFTDYSATFTLYDDDYYPIDEGKITVELAGTESTHNGQLVIEKLLPGNYSYEVIVPGYLPYSGEMNITDANIEQNLFIEIPPFPYYEDFENEGIPDDYTVINPHQDYFAYNAGELVFQKTADPSTKTYVVLPKITIDQGCVFSIKAGKSVGRSYLGIGIVTDPDNPAESYSEIANYEIFALENMRTFGARLEQQAVNDGFVCIEITAEAVNNYFSIDDAIVIENVPGCKVQFHVTDHDGEVLPEVQVTFVEDTKTTNDFGYASWHDCDEAQYPYSVTYKGEEIETGSIDLYGDMIIEVVHNTSGIELIKNDQFSFYPNPASDQIIFKGITTGSIEIIDLNGQTLIQHSIEQGHTISISELPIGVYLVKIKSDHEEIVQKLLKQ